MSLFLKILKWGAISIVVAFAALVVYRMFYLRNEAKTNEQVAKIHATKLSLDDVMGKNLPPDPGTLADQTVAGIDANKNNIRDDVELAVFKEYQPPLFPTDNKKILFLRWITVIDSRQTYLYNRPMQIS